MLERIEIRGYQSLADVDILLRGFTVITGPTGAGKSGVIRAVRMLALNARGTDYITRGRASCSVCAGDGAMAVRITRSRNRGKDAYQLAALEPHPAVPGEWGVAKYTKLAGQVPPQVTAALGMSPLNFAGQHDAPFLLAVSGPELARVLGRLTNVSLVLAAAGEANLRRKRLDADLKRARERQEALLAEGTRLMDGLLHRRRAVQSAEEDLARLQETSASLARLGALTARLRAAQGALTAARAEAARREPPSPAALEDLAGRAARLEDLAGRARAARASAESCLADAEAQRERAAKAGELAHEALKAAGQCPTCGQAVA